MSSRDIIEEEFSEEGQLLSSYDMEARGAEFVLIDRETGEETPLPPSVCAMFREGLDLLTGDPDAKRETAAEGVMQEALRHLLMSRAATVLAHEQALAPVLVQAPGSGLLSFVNLLPVTSGLRRAVCEQIADMRHEHFEALQAGDHERADRIAFFGRLTTIWTALKYIGTWGFIAYVVKVLFGK